MTWRDDLTMLVRVHGPRLRRTAYLLCGDRAAADDLVRDTYVRALSRRQTGALAAALEADDGEALLRRTLIGEYFESDRRARGVGRRAAHGPATQALAQLPAQGRVCVVLRHDLDLPPATIADDLDVSEAVVTRYLGDARAILRAGGGGASGGSAPGPGAR